MVEEIRFLFRYNKWANDRFMTAMERLNSEQFTRTITSSFPSIQETLHHLIFAEWLWLSRWKGNSPSEPPSSWDTSTFESMRRLLSDTQNDQRAFLAALSNSDLEKVVHFRRVSGEPMHAPLHHLMRHVINHATYHRGQLTTLIRQVGGNVTSTDLLGFVMIEQSSSE